MAALYTSSSDQELENMMADSLNFFSTQNYPDCDSISTSFVDNLLSDHTQQMNVSTANNSPSEASMHPPSDITLANLGAEYNMPTQEMTPLVDEEDLLIRLVDIQSRLTKLARSLSSNSGEHKDVEDIYRVSETLIGILDSVEDPSKFHSSTPSSIRPSGVASLLLSSCYFSLIHAYEFLVTMLQREFAGQHQLPTTDPFLSAMDYNSRNTLRQGGVPSISVGTVRIAMPRRAAAEINLHLVAQTLQHLRGSMQQCVSRMTAAQMPSSNSSQRASWDSIETPDGVTGLAEMALGELRRREDNLMGQLRTTMLSLESGTNV